MNNCYVFMRTIAITGGRDRLPTKDQRRAMAQLDISIPTHLVNGGARGIDTAVAERAKKAGWIVTTIYYQSFLKDKGGHTRNAILVRSGDFLITFGGNKGTANCVEQAIKWGCPVVDWSGLVGREGENWKLHLPAARKRKRWSGKPRKRRAESD